MKYWIETYTGKRFDYEHIELNKIDIRDIAHALSNTCRFNGHCSEFYSVAEHSVNVAIAISQCKHMLPALLHDATEAYMPDVSKPLKGYWNTFFKLEEFEAKMSDHIYRQLGVPIDDEIWRQIKLYDYAMLRRERDILFKDKQLWEFPEDIPVTNLEIHKWSPQVAEKMFLKLYNLINT